MEAYAKVLSYAIPGFVMLILIESWVGKFMGIKVNRAFDTISSLSSGMTNTIKSIMGLTFVIVSYHWMVSHLAIFEIKSTVWLYVLAFIGIDFVGYWSHRFDHVINLFWNRHVVHHSSEEFNLSCALRQSISAFVGVYFFLYIPMAIIGVPGNIISVVAPLHLFAQFWYHTRLINRLGILEYIIVTPAHHRVHHAINDEYLDKNYSQIFIVWDRLFGTFQDELPNVPPVYGTKKPANTWNPVIINFQHLWLLIKDAWRTESWLDKLRIWFMPTGWRPADVKEKYPIQIVEDVYNRPKYDTTGSKLFIIWAWAQLVIHNILLFYILQTFTNYPKADFVLVAIFMMVSIFAYTTLMDKNKLAVYTEAIKFAMGILLIYRNGGWFGLDAYVPAGSMIVVGYLLLSMVATLYFAYMESGSEHSELQTS